MAILRELDRIIRFCTKVKIIEQETDIFPNHSKDKMIYETKEDGYQYGEFRYLVDYEDYQVCMIAQNDGFVEIYICHPIQEEN